MKKNMSTYRTSILVAIVCLFSISAIYSQNNLNKITNRLSEKISELEDNQTELVWIYFTDKGKSLNKYFEKPSLVVSPKSLARRAKYYKAKPLIDITDIPVNEDYIKQLEKLGIKIKHRTKWFNGVSAFVKKEIIEKISDLIFVKKIDLVGKLGLNKDIEQPKGNDNYPNKFIPNKTSNHVYNYGLALAQLNQINVPAVHDSGYIGTGITIAVMDAGVDKLTHEAFTSRPTKIISTYDFVNDDSNIGNQNDAGEGSHGTYTLSIIGGFNSGNLIGPAFDANFLLAKTENTESETRVEEDNWVAAMEWAEGLGADIISTSLGYNYFFTNPSENYTWQDMDGNTTIITKAADLAVGKGIVVVNSIGNERSDGINNGYDNSIGAPADGDSVIAVGAVSVSTGIITSFSSYGPTSDGRIKPDVSAGGSGVWFATSSPSVYSSGDGTSFSCPLVAGVSALILQRNPNLTPLQVREALRETASKSNNPDNDYGWGIINALNAVYYYSLTDVDNDNIEVIPEDFALNQNYPNPFNPTTRIRYHVKIAGFVTLKIFNVLGNQVALLVNREKPAGTYEVQFNAESEGRSLPSGVYFYRLTIGDFVSTKKMILAK